MAKTTFSVRAGIAGEISTLMEGRTDWDKYPFAMKKLMNFLPAQQGAILRRPGTKLIATIDQRCRLVPFHFSNEQAFMLLFSGDGKLYQLDEAGILEAT